MSRNEKKHEKNENDEQKENRFPLAKHSRVQLRVLAAACGAHADVGLAYEEGKKKVLDAWRQECGETISCGHIEA